MATPRKRPTTDHPAVDAEVVDLASRRTTPGPEPLPRAYLELALDDLTGDADNVRVSLRGLDELARSIAAVGVLEPLLVTPAGDRWRILAGHRRAAAATMAGLTHVPCLAHTSTTSATDRIELQLIENLQRDDLTPIEEALGYQALVDAGDTQRRIAERVGRNQSHISKRLKLLTLPAKCQSQVEAGELTVEDALALTALVEHPERINEAIALTKPDKHGWPEADTMAEAVDTQLRIVEREQARLAAFAELHEAGIRVVDWPKTGYGDTGWPAGHRRIDQGYKWPGGKAPTKAKLAKAGHLAAAVDPSGGVVYLCTEAARYELRPSEAKATGGHVDDDDAARRRALNKRLRADAHRRLGVAGRYVRNTSPGNIANITEAVAGDRRLGKPTSLWVASVLGTWLNLIGYIRADATKVACEVLDINKGTSLQRLAAKPDYTGRVELAVWIALAEERITHRQLVDPLVTAYYRWLNELRYEPGAEERQDLETALGQAKAS